MMDLRKLLLIVGLAIFALAGCGSPEPSPPTGVGTGTESEGEGTEPQTQELETVVFRLDWTKFASHGPFYYGRNMGFFEEEGIDLDIREGNGSSSTAQTVGNGQDDFGLADASTVLTLISKGLDAKIIANFFATSAEGLIYLEEKGWDSFADVAGATIATTQQGSEAILLPAMLAAGGIAQDQVHYLNIAGDARLAAIMERDADAFFSLGLLQIPIMEQQGFPAKMFTLPSVGLNIPGHMIITSNKLIEENPDLIRRFLRAYVKTLAASMENPEAVAQAIVDESDILGMDIAVPQVQETVRLFESPSTQGQPLGWIPPSDIEQLQETLHAYGDLDTPQPIETYFTNEFLPEP